MGTNSNNRLPARTSSTPELPAAPAQPGSTLLALAKMALEKTGNAAGKAATGARRAARGAGRFAKRVAPEKPADIAIEESAAIASHAGAHALHHVGGPIAVGVKGSLELLALVVAKLKSRSPRLLRGLRSSLRGTLHHSLGAGLHSKWPLLGGSAQGIKTAGVDDEGDVGEGGGEEPQNDF